MWLKAFTVVIVLYKSFCVITRRQSMAGNQRFRTNICPFFRVILMLNTKHSHPNDFCKQFYFCPDCQIWYHITCRCFSQVKVPKRLWCRTKFGSSTGVYKWSDYFSGHLMSSEMSFGTDWIIKWIFSRGRLKTFGTDKKTHVNAGKTNAFFKTLAEMCDGTI